jgi:predicted alpha/beta superfamily hydrolase
MAYMDLKYEIIGDPASRYWLIQIMDESDERDVSKEIECIHAGLEEIEVCFIMFTGVDWNRDLTPWMAPAVFKGADFGSGAEETRLEMERILHRIAVLNRQHIVDKCLVIGGYSLAGLFTLWCAYNSTLFYGAVAASPSVWYPKWISYAKSNRCHCKRVYLSLGDKEKNTKNEILSQVEDKIHRQLQLLKSDPNVHDSTLVMNPGNHFDKPWERTASGFVWALQEQLILDEAMKRG